MVTGPETVPARPLGHDFDAFETPAGDLLELILQRPAWHADALCREHPEVDFFPPRGDDTRTAKAICADCLVQPDCLDAAMAHNERFGVWGGTGVDERKQLRRGHLVRSDGYRRDGAA